MLGQRTGPRPHLDDGIFQSDVELIGNPARHVRITEEILAQLPARHYSGGLERVANLMSCHAPSDAPSADSRQDHISRLPPGKISKHLNGTNATRSNPIENRAQVQFSCKGEQQLSASAGFRLTSPAWVDELGRRGVGALRRLFFARGK
jgi:hypothetical protein